MRRAIAVLAAAVAPLALGCADAERSPGAADEAGGAPPAGAQAAEVPVLAGRAEVVLDSLETGAAGDRIAGATVDARGRVVLVDAADDALRVHAPGGGLLYRVGVPGGATEGLLDPCCPAFGPDGRLWIRDRGHGRYVAFELGESDGRAVDSLPMAHPPDDLAVPTTFDAEGRLVDVGREFDPTTGRERLVRYHLDADGAVAARRAIPEPPLDSLALARVQTDMSEVLVHRPFGPVHLVAHAPGGGWAEALSSRYEVLWHLPGGDTVRISRPEVRGPAVGAEEARAAGRRLAATLEPLGADSARLGLGVPERKPPLDELAFDRSGRLWVSLLVPDGQPRTADVYGPDGRLRARVRWPAGLALVRDFVTDSVALAVSRDGAPRQRLLRLRFEPAPR